MDNTSFQTSFIPKKPILEEKPRPINRPINIFSVISTLLFIVAIVSYGGLFFYKHILLSQIEGLQSSLSRAKESFEPETISELQLFDKRISVSKEVIANHTVLSPFFKYLAELTIPNIQYVKFAEELSPAKKGFSVKMSGLAKDYKSIALQAEVFNSAKGKYFKDVVFSNLVLSDDKDKKGYIGFDVAFLVDPSLLSYEKQILELSGSKKSAPVNTPIPSEPVPVEKVESNTGIPTPSVTSGASTNEKVDTTNIAPKKQ